MIVTGDDTDKQVFSFFENKLTTLPQTLIMQKPQNNNITFVF